jgi:transposase
LHAERICASPGRRAGRCQVAKKAPVAKKRAPRRGLQVGAFIAQEFGIEYQGRSGLIMLLHRLGMEHRKPQAISRKLDPPKQAAFIKRYDELMNQLGADEAPIAIRPAGEIG